MENTSDIINPTGEKSEGMHPLNGVEPFEEHMKSMQASEYVQQKKTFEQKAEENGYFKDENGEWRNHKLGTLVKWFKLDEEYPDLADKTEALAKKYNVNYNDRASLKQYIYENADTLEKASDEHLANIFKIAGDIPSASFDVGAKLVNYNLDDLKNISKSLDRYYEIVADKIPDVKDNRRISRITQRFVSHYADKLIEGDFVDELAKYSIEACLKNNLDSNALIGDMEYGIIGIANNESSGKYFGDYIKCIDELINDKKSNAGNVNKDSVLASYVLVHGLDPNTVNGFKGVVFPLMDQKDDEVTPIINGRNNFAVVPGEYGIADYTEECLISLCTPKDIDKLVRIYHEIPTSDYKKFEQNRKDAARLQGIIIRDRSFIHDEHPGVHEVLVAMKNFYDHRESEDVYKYMEKLVEVEEKYHFGVLPNAFDLDRYEEPVEEMSEFNPADEGDPSERAIDILNRLVKNTEPALLEAPMTKNPELNELMSKIQPLLNEKTGEVKVEIKEVGPALHKINRLIQQNYNKQGIYPSIVSAIAFLDKMSAYALRNTDQKKVKELIFDPDFKEMVRFSQLTSSMGYDGGDFEHKYKQISDKISEAYKEDYVDSLAVADGYRMLSQQILQNMHALGKNYASKATTERFKDAIWSGNLNDELIGLFQRA